VPQTEEKPVSKGRGGGGKKVLFPRLKRRVGTSDNAQTIIKTRKITLRLQSRVQLSLLFDNAQMNPGKGSRRGCPFLGA